MVAPARRPVRHAEARHLDPARRQAATAPATRRQAAPPRRPALRVVDPKKVAAANARQRRARLVAFGGGLVLVVSLLATAASHALLVSGQAHLDALQGRVDEAQARYSRARLQVAELEAPERIVREAQERLGMVPPPRVTYLSPSGAVAAEVGAGDVSEPAPTPAAASGWAQVKPYLATQRAR